MNTDKFSIIQDRYCSITELPSGKAPLGALVNNLLAFSMYIHAPGIPPTILFIDIDDGFII